MAPVLAASDSRQMAPAPLIAAFHHSEFSPDGLVRAKLANAATIHVLIPARDEEATIADIVEVVRSELMGAVALVDELIVIDDASLDGTAELAMSRGATVVSGPGLGKGEAMKAALGSLCAEKDAIVVFLDGDVLEFGAHFVLGLVGPLLCHESLHIVKASYRRPLGGEAAGGGRVTELVAKPALALCVPELAAVDQPLAGETAVRASLLAELDLAGGYAVEAAMLIDAYRRCGLGAIAQVDLGERRHRNRSLLELVPQARAVLETILERADVQRRVGEGS
ncbi:MAG: glucosyl-3-phosphoglycerate synthase [Acidimicrobiales bacterium]